MKDFLLDIASLIYPRVCVACDGSLFKHEQHICNKCFVTLPKTNYHLQKENPLQKTFYGRADVSSASSFLFFQKKGMVQKILHALKYKGKPEVAQLVGKWYAEDLKQDNASLAFDYIIPVPLHKKRQQKRGYNQSEYFAKGLSEVLDIPILTNVLIKKQFTETQTHKTRAERAENILQSFSVEHTEIIDNKSILLVDDVITTGATLEACMIQLQKSTNTKVSVASIAYAQ
ncbi:MAG TPA: ComF family protein [Bacteroidia bacterium]